ncbi:MAG: iron-containing alcohol dehydrogenase [Firmicutes bacterium]|nr:iron-containing alcohol dehydrogenase [Bacillota bacterium]
MNSFVYENPVKVYFGENGVDTHLANELAKYGKNIMLAYGKGSVVRNGIYDQVVKVLKACGKNIIELTDIPANPSYEKVCEGIKLYKENDVDLILAVGGGSVVDCVKVITSGVYVEEDIWTLQFEKGIVPEKMGNYAVILTISGAGAEMDNLGAITKGNDKKTFVASYAKFVILDPTYLKTIPQKAFMPGAFDSLTHCMETYFGQTYNVSDRMNEGLMKDIVLNMREIINGNDTLEIRSNLMWDASLVQTFLFNVGKPGDFQGHFIENTLGAYSHGTHGRQLAVILPVYYQHVYKDDVQKFALFARNVMDVKEENDLIAAQLGLKEFEKLIEDAGLVRTFTELGFDLTDEIAKEIAGKAPISQGNARQLTKEEIMEILMACK